MLACATCGDEAALRPDLAAALGSERFLREIKIAANLTHPHILPLHDSGEADGFLYYVMPYIKGDTLRERIEKEGETAGGGGGAHLTSLYRVQCVPTRSKSSSPTVTGYTRSVRCRRDP